MDGVCFYDELPSKVDATNALKRDHDHFLTVKESEVFCHCWWSDTVLLLIEFLAVPKKMGYQI